MKKKYISIFILILIIGFIFFLFLKESKKKEEFDILEITERWITGLKPDITGIDWLNDNTWLLVSAKSTKLPKNYYESNKSIEYETTSPIIGLTKLILINQERFSPMNGGNKPDFSVTYQLEIYSIERQSIKKIKDIDLQKKVKEINKNYTVDNIYSFTYDENFVNFSIHAVNESFYLDLSDEKIFKEAEMDQEILKKTAEANQVPKEYKFISVTNFQDRKVVDNSGFFVSLTNPNQQILIGNKKENPKSIALEEKYPETKKIFDNDGFGYIDYSQAPPSAEELAKLLVPKNTDPWEGVVLDSKYSTDNEEHTIHSIEDFLKWFSEKEN
ncbi:hypothetical protein [Enterococcus sp. 5H]|uniref:hypothetical protein n=1 Tax=Enterococcus sp. 5H TaxID=1229490 RepID=UPI0023034F89|nr:hypothetical protein [Enterococcus sp. 5H]MDA9471088.1 hypothetical protein [Enterococcus sp. 5H]